MTDGVTPTRPVPDITALNRPFWDAAAEHRLVIQQCPQCERYQHESVHLCPACGAELGWQEVSGRGTVYTFVMMHQVYHPAFAGDVPYNVTVVQLDEGPFMTTRIVGAGAGDPAIGDRVRVTFDDVSQGFSLPCFERSERPVPG